jgi:plastocyanin
MAPSIVTVLVGLSHTGSQGSQIAYTPKFIDVTTGDTVKFLMNDNLEPHTVTFGPMPMLKKMSDNFVAPVPQKNGPPIVAVDPKGANPSMGHTYNGMGIANSGIMTHAGQSWKLTFTAPGKYQYICLVHGTSMTGWVIVHAPQQGHMWFVQVGDGQAAFKDNTNTTTNDQFYPRHLTIHVGDTVEWIGFFHTITFGPDAMLVQLEKNFIIPITPVTSMPPKLQINPKVAFPSGGSTYNGTGFVNSGILVFTTPQGSNAPPTFKLKFTAAGTFAYDCLVHPGMDGTITVM